MATSLENIALAKGNNIEGGIYLSMSQLRKLANLDLEKVYIDAGKRPDGVLFQIGQKEDSSYTIEMLAYEYGENKRVQLLSFKSGEVLRPGFIQAELGCQLPDEPTFPNTTFRDNNNFRINTEGGGGGAGAAQAYPTPGR